MIFISTLNNTKIRIRINSSLKEKWGEACLINHQVNSFLSYKLFNSILNLCILIIQFFFEDEIQNC